MRRDDPEATPLGITGHLPAEADVVIAALTPLLSAARKAKIEAAVASRTRDVIPVLEEFHDPHNVSAVLRSADAFGVQEVALIRSDLDFLAAKRVAKGTERWLDLHFFECAQACVDFLREREFTIYAASMEGALRPSDISPDAGGPAKVAVVFGNEHAGPSAQIRKAVDGVFQIPMVGFVDSLNVSVAAATTLHVLRASRRGTLEEAQKQELIARFMMNSAKDAARIVEQYQASLQQ